MWDLSVKFQFSKIMSFGPYKILLPRFLCPSRVTKKRQKLCESLCSLKLIAFTPSKSSVCSPIALENYDVFHWLEDTSNSWRPLFSPPGHLGPHQRPLRYRHGRLPTIDALYYRCIAKSSFFFVDYKFSTRYPRCPKTGTRTIAYNI